MPARSAPPSTVAGVRVAAHEDYTARQRTDADGHTAQIALPKANMARLLLENGAWIVVRPSGTEPKLKLYIGANASGEVAVQAELDRLFADTNGRIEALLNR